MCHIQYILQTKARHIFRCICSSCDRLGILCEGSDYFWDSVHRLSVKAGAKTVGKIMAGGFLQRRKKQLKKAESRLADWDSVGVDYFLLDPDLEKRNQIRILSSTYRRK